MTKTIYRVELRRQGGRSKSGRFTSRHLDPKLIEVDGKNAAHERAILGDRVAAALDAVSGSSPVDRVVVERMGVIE